MTASDIKIIVSAEDQASANIKKVQNSIGKMRDSVGSSSKTMQGSIAEMNSSFSGLGKVVGVIGTVFAALGATKALFGLTSQVEQSKIAFETLLGSGEKATAMLRDIDEFAAKTPFEKVNLTPLVQQLIGMGFEASKTLPIVSVLGDSMAALGRGQDDLNGVVLALGQIQTKGKLSAEELMQLAERGLPVYQILEKQLGLTKKQLENVGGSGITAAQGISALLTGLNEKFGGSMVKQAQTLQGQWSNLLDNVKSITGNAGQNINDKVKGWISSINDFFDKNRPIIAKFIDDVLQIVGSMAEGIGTAFGAVWDVVSTVISAITGETTQSAGNQMKAWQAVFMVIGNGVQGAALLISYVVRGVMGGIKILAAAAQTVADTVVGFIGGVIGEMANSIIAMINVVISGIDKLLVLAGQSATGWQIKSVSLAKKSAEFIKESWNGAGEDIGNAWNEMSNGMSADTSRIVGNMVSSMERYQASANTTASVQSDLGARIKSTLDGMSGSLSNVGKAQSNAKDSAKAHNEELKKLKESAENAIKPIIDRIKETQKETDEARKKIKEKAEEWKKYRQEGIKALSDVNAEISKLKKEASDITVKITSEKDKNLGERNLEVAKEIKSTNEDIAKLKEDIAKEDSPDKQRELLALGQKVTDLEKERDYIKSNASQKVLDEATAYGNLSKAQQIVANSQKEQARQLEENQKKQDAAIEKRMILEAQANQKSISDLGIQTGLKDGMLTASVELEKGKRIEIHDQENINLANDIAQKQLSFKTEFDTLTTQLGLKLQAQKNHIGQTQDLYKEFNQFLKDDTKKTAEDMMGKLAQVNAQLRETIKLRSTAGFNSAPSGGEVSGKRAVGGPVDSGRTYLVGENGPELFSPARSGQILPNGSLGSATTINVSLGGVVVQEKADIDRLVSRLSDELARRLELGKLGIS